MAQAASPQRSDYPRRTLKFTREGRFFVLVTLGVGAAAVNTGNNLIFMMLGLMLSLIIVSGVLSDLVLIGLSARVEIPEGLRAKEVGHAYLIVNNRKKRLASYTLTLEIRLSDDSLATTYVLRVPPAATSREAFDITPQRRGRLSLTSLRCTTAYPFALFSKTISLHRLDADGLVYPERLPRAGDAAFLELAIDAETRAQEGLANDTLWLRPFREGDELRRVHATKSAQVGKLIARQLSTEEQPSLKVHLRTELPSFLFEQQVKEVASALYRAEEHGAAFELTADDGVSFTGHTRVDYRAAYAYLATVACRESSKLEFPSTRVA